MGSKKRKLRKRMKKRDLEKEPALVVCVGKSCCRRAESREVLEAAREYAEAVHPAVHVVAVDCLDICKKGPIAATYPRIRFKKHVSPKRACKLIDKLDK